MNKAHQGSIEVEKEADCDGSSNSSFFTNYEWAFFIGLLVVGFLLRWLDLESKPMHHDESLHGMYGRYFYDWPEIQFYKYDPMLHGPLLYNSYRLLYSTFGLGDWAVRTAVAIPGTILIFLPFLFRRYFSPTAVLMLTAVVSLSPTLIYWSRLIHHDLHVLLSMVVMVYGFTLASSSWRAPFVLLGISVHWCTKENIFITLALLLGYLVYEVAFVNFVTKEARSAVKAIWHHIKQYRYQFLLGFLFAAFVYCYFYGAGFRSDENWSYWKGIKDGLGFASIPYWLDQHKMERIKGEFLYHFYLLAWYELPFIMAFLFQVALFYRSAGKMMGRIGYSFIALGVIVALISTYWVRWSETPKPYEELAYVKWLSATFNLNLKGPLDFVGLVVLVPYAVLVTTYHLLRGEKALAFWGYFFGATFFSYSYVGEKVPWLGVYPFVSGLVYLTLYFDKLYGGYPQKWYRQVSVENALLTIGSISVFLFCLFSFESDTESFNRTLIPIVSLVLLGGAIAGYRALGKFMPSVALLILATLILILKSGKNEDIGFLVWGVIFLITAYFGPKLNMIGTFNLRNAVLILFCVYSLRAAILTNYTYAGEGEEFIGQVHTTKQLHEIATRVRREIITQSRGFKPLVLAEGESVWPITWYLRDLPEYKFSANREEWKNFTYLFIDYKEDGSNVQNLPPGFTHRRVDLRGWWVPDWNQATVKRFLNYTLNHKPWSPAGYSYATMLTNSNPPAEAAP